MRSISFAVALFILLFAGCSSTYRVNNFSSKEKFYDDFNNSVKSKELKVTLMNDSTFTIEDGTVIENDILFSFGKLEEKKNMRFELSDISEINYSSNDYQTAIVLLKNGGELTAENIRIIHDSINFVEIKTLITKNNIVPIDKVKTASYKNRWRNIPLGAITGILSGGIIGYLWGNNVKDYHGDYQGSFGLIGGAFLGFITCGVLGSVIGRNIIYQFNP